MWRDGMRGTEPPTPKVQQKRLFCFPHQEVQKGLHPAQPPSPLGAKMVREVAIFKDSS